ncbi:hypothetical protein GT003_18010 [Paenibacillus sacheonensis]|uniref:Uncharacterized protein n=1 Tax=Paenibacillus sacheonensis TaxID=742054 RepID=A0A7X4YSU4_9BACL|nr:hypothetical protein [Paenibacillus sacheonensis]
MLGPTAHLTAHLTARPTGQPTGQPTGRLTAQPTAQPMRHTLVGCRRHLPAKAEQLPRGGRQIGVWAGCRRTER